MSLTEIEVTSTRLLEMIESAYPNPLSVSEMARYVMLLIDIQCDNNYNFCFSGKRRVKHRRYPHCSQNFKLVVW